MTERHRCDRRGAHAARGILKAAGAVFGLLACASVHAGAQGARVGRLEGTITERARNRSVGNASVEVVRIDSESAASFRSLPDTRGRFHIDSLPDGRYAMQLSSATLDSLDLTLPQNELQIIAGQTARADLALPGGTAMRDAVCAGAVLGKGEGVVAGRASNTDTDQPLAGANVVVAWTEVTVNKATLETITQRRSGGVRTGPRGEYRLCGVPTGRWLSIRLEAVDRAGDPARVTVSEEEGAVVRNLSLSVRNAPLMPGDSVEARAREGDANARPDLKGTATLSGTVRGSGGQLLPDAELRVAGAASIASSDAAGQFTLEDLPAGSRVLNARRIGYVTMESTVSLKAGEAVTHDLAMQRVVSLDSVRVVAQRSRYAQFEYNRRTNPFGKFLNAEEIGRAGVTELTEVLARFGGFVVSGHGPDATVVSILARAQQPRCKETNVVIDGVPRAGMNYVPLSQVAGVEIYRDGVDAPGPFRGECGLIVIWTKQHQPATKRAPTPEPSPAV